ncbi:PRC-barrel domain protein [Methanothermus fervidus DSM 2088]|uniref:PRC-barrel domain protein n=1 Tax=Methanothermus fervidus (strain ATCC 43054 / DSM 2088 / JCM 10308 / V24 S) TaxID=523846 RepID=E3GZ40_METFV|nr:PRC-barrel domain-containing protein [Methanothermus fervidus]ADP77572.1 PRC-barrel domain protein [Methanothermus fervidus DSM 2088]
MVEKTKIKSEEKIWSEIRGYRVATNNARILGDLEEIIINDKTGKITDIVVKVEKDKKNVNLRGAKRRGDYLYIPFHRVEKVGEFIIITE